jgi:hypothetical protein
MFGRRFFQHTAALAILAWLNLYIAREFFIRESTAYMNSMHGFWIAIARWAGDGWWKPVWWPYWDAGMPFEHTYAPLVPFLISVWAKLGGISEAAAFLRVSGVVYCAGPLALYLLGVVVTRSSGYAFAAAVAYSLSALSQLIVPDVALDWTHAVDARRLYLTAVWDETPHLLALAFALAAVALLIVAVRRRSWLHWTGASLLMGAAILSSLFAIPVLALAGLCVILSSQRSVLMTVSAGMCGWAIASPFASPSLLLQVQRVSQTYPEGRTTWTSAAGLALVALLGWLICRGKPPQLRFAILLALAVTAPPLTLHWLKFNLLPQAGRYTLEMEAAFALLAVVLAQPLLDRIRPIGRAGICLLLIVAASWQTITHRRFAKQLIREASLEQTVESRAARWVEKNMPFSRVMFPGSMAQWANAFAPVHQLSGSSFSQAPNLPLQQALDDIYQAGADPGRSLQTALTKLRDFGADAVMVPAKDSAEFWKPFARPELYREGLEPLWQEQGVTLYATGRQGSPMKWTGPNRVLVRLEGENSSVKINHHPGWRNTEQDELGLIRLRHACVKPCEVELVYDGGWELRLLRWLSLATLAGLAIIFSLSCRRTASSPSPPKYSCSELR